MSSLVFISWCWIPWLIVEYWLKFHNEGEIRLLWLLYIHGDAEWLAVIVSSLLEDLCSFQLFSATCNLVWLKYTNIAIYLVPD